MMHSMAPSSSRRDMRDANPIGAWLSTRHRESRCLVLPATASSIPTLLYEGSRDGKGSLLLAPLHLWSSVSRQRKAIANPAGEALCRVWQERLYLMRLAAGGWNGTSRHTRAHIGDKGAKNARSRKN